MRQHDVKEDKLDALHRQTIDLKTSLETALEKKEKLNELHREKIDLAIKLAAALATVLDKEEEINQCSIGQQPIFNAAKTTG